MEIREATVLPIKASASDEFVNTHIFSLPKIPGLFRRVSREGRTGMKTAPDTVVAIVDKIHLCEFVRWKAGENILRPLMPGVESPISNEEGNPLDVERPGETETKV